MDHHIRNLKKRNYRANVSASHQKKCQSPTAPKQQDVVAWWLEKDVGGQDSDHTGNVHGKKIHQTLTFN